MAKRIDYAKRIEAKMAEDARLVEVFTKINCESFAVKYRGNIIQGRECLEMIKAGHNAKEVWETYSTWGYGK